MMDLKYLKKMDYLNDSDEPDGISNSMANVIKVASKIFKKINQIS